MVWNCEVYFLSLEKHSNYCKIHDLTINKRESVFEMGEKTTLLN
jgi:hypothetical protein